MKLNRREFLRRTALAASAPPSTPAPRPGRNSARDFRSLWPGHFGPDQDSNVPFLSGRIGMRGGQRALNQTRLGKEKFEALIRGAYERGTRMFDLADLYGTHPYIIPALQEFRATAIKS